MTITKWTTFSLKIWVLMVGVGLCFATYAINQPIQLAGYDEHHHYHYGHDPDYYGRYGYDPDEYYDHNGYYNHGGYYNSGSLAAPGVSIGDPYNGFYSTPSTSCSVIQQCTSNGCIEYRNCD